MDPLAALLGVRFAQAIAAGAGAAVPGDPGFVDLIKYYSAFATEHVRHMGATHSPMQGRLGRDAMGIPRVLERAELVLHEKMPVAILHTRPPVITMTLNAIDPAQMVGQVRDDGLVAANIDGQRAETLAAWGQAMFFGIVRASLDKVQVGRNSSDTVDVVCSGMTEYRNTGRYFLQPLEMISFLLPVADDPMVRMPIGDQTTLEIMALLARPTFANHDPVVLRPGSGTTWMQIDRDATLYDAHGVNLTPTAVWAGHPGIFEEIS